MSLLKGKILGLLKPVKPCKNFPPRVWNDIFALENYSAQQI